MPTSSDDTTPRAADTVPATIAPSPPPEVAARRRRRVVSWRVVARITAAVTVGWVVLDQLVKAIGTNVWATDPVDLGLLRLVDVRNTDAAFNIPGLFPGFFLVVTVIVAALVLRAVPRTDHPWLGVAYGLVLGGAVGNALDRVFRDPGFPDGAVVDVFDVGWFPVFNVADSGITIGAVLLVLLLSRLDREEREAERDRERHRSVRPETAPPSA